MNVLSSAELAGITVERADLLAEAADRAIIQTRAELTHGSAFEASILYGIMAVKTMYGLTEKEATEIAKSTTAEFFGKTDAEIDEEAKSFWEQSRKEFLSDQA